MYDLNSKEYISKTLDSIPNLGKPNKCSNAIDRKAGTMSQIIASNHNKAVDSELSFRMKESPRKTVFVGESSPENEARMSKRITFA